MVFGNHVFSQQLKLGSNPAIIEKSAVLELQSGKQGLLFTRITDTALINALSPPDGMVIYFVPAKSLLVRSNGYWQALTTPSYFNNYWSVNGNNNGGIHKLGNIDNYDLSLITNNTDRLRISASGNVGIGNTSPTQKLDVTGNFRLSGAFMPDNSAGNAGSFLQSNGSGAAPSWVDASAYLSNISWVFGGNTVSSLKNLGTINNYHLPFITNNVERMRLTTSGYLGIDVISPTEKLDVNGNIKFSGALMPNNSAGTTGYLLKSNGDGAAPAWINPVLSVLSDVSLSTPASGQILQYNGSAWANTTVSYIPSSRTINTTAPLTGGGDLTADRTLSISNNGISNSLLRQSAALSVIGNSTNATANVADITAGTDGFVLRRSGTTLGFGTIATAGITNSAVTYAKIQNVSATNRLLGRASAGAGVVEEITLGAGLSYSGTTLNISSVPNSALSNSTIGLTLGSTGTDANVSGSPASLGGSLTLNLPSASASNRGLLTSSDWTTFNNKLSGVDTSNIANFHLKVKSLFSASAPITYSNGLIGITQASATTNGYLSSADWNTFNNKLGSVSGGNLTESTSSVLTITGGTGAVLGSGTSIQVKQANASQSGFLSSTDWNTFNNKISGNQTITLSGDVSGSGTTAITTTIGAGKVSNSMLAGSIAASKLIGTDIATVGTITAGTWNGTKISEAYGGTNQTAYALGDILYASATNTLSRLAGNTTAAKRFLSQTGTGTVSAAPAWSTLTSGDVGLGNVPNIDATNANNITSGTLSNARLTQASSTTSGYLSSADWNTFNNKLGSVTAGNLTESTSSVLTITGGAGAVLGSGTSIQVKQANASQSGFLSSTDWNTFNNKLSAIDTSNISNFHLKVKSLFSAGTGISYDPATGVISTSATGNFWNLNGNTVGSVKTIGTIDNYALPFITNNTERMRIDAAGRVGIGVTDPANNLVVKDGIEVRRVGSISQLLFSNTAGTGDFRIGADGGDIFWQGGGGRSLQMGSHWTTILAGDRQTSAFPSFTGTVSNTGVLVLSQRDASVPLAIQANSATQTANLTEWRTSTGTVLNAIDKNGNIGIGNSSPTEKVDITGNVKFSGALMPNNNAGTSGYYLKSNGAGVAPSWESTLPIAQGGTGQTTANAALNALLPSQSGNSGKVLSTNGSNASWVSGSSLSSDDYVYSYSTSTKTFSSAGNWVDITFNTAHPQLSGWTHSLSSNSQNFTCTQTGVYQVIYSGQANNTSSNTYELAIRAVLNGTEIPGSVSSVQCSNSNPTIASNFLVDIDSGDVLKLQLTGSNTAMRLSPGAYGTTKPTITITIIRIK